MNQFGITPKPGQMYKSMAHKQAADAQAAQANQPVGPQYNTTITPRPIYNQQQTQMAMNQALAQGAQHADPRWNMKQYSGLGRSQDSGTAAAALPGMANALAQGNAMAGQIYLGDTLANQQSLLAGQMAREGEGLGLGNLAARLYENQITQRNQNLSPLLQMLMGLV